MRARCRLLGGRYAFDTVCSTGDEWRQIVHFEMSGGNSRETGPHFVSRRFKNRQPLANDRKAATHCGERSGFRDKLL